MLKDDDFARAVIEIFNKIVETEGTCYLEKWEYFKQEVKQAAVERSSYLKHEARREEKTLQKYWHELFQIENSNPGAMTQEIKQVRAKLNHAA